MKRKITFHAFMAFILILVAFGCRQEHEVVKAQIATNAKIFRKPLEELPEIQNSVKKIEENLKKVKQTGKTVADYNVDTENVLVMSFDDKSTAYSLIIENADIDVADPYYVENINIYNDGTNDFQYITRYVPSDGLPFYSYSAFNGEVQFYDIDHNFLFSKSTTDISCTTCRQMAFSLGCYDYVINDNAGYWQIQSVSNHCGGSSTPPNGGSTGSSGSSGSGTGDISGSSGTGGTGGSSGGYSAPTNPYIPNIPTQDAIEAKFYKNFLSNLNTDQYNFLGHNQDYNDEVFNYLSSNNFSVDSKSFMKWGISFFVQNTDSAGTCNVSWGEFQNWFVDGYSPQYKTNVAKLNATQLQEFVAINKDIEVSPYEEDFVKETNHIFAAFASSGYLDIPNATNLSIASNNMCCVGVGTLPAGWFFITQTQERVKEITANYAALRNLYPNWSKWKCFWEATRDTIQLLLDIGGTVPLIGEVCDLTNGAIYTMNGDALNASLSYASAIPLAGWGSAAAKFAVRGVELANGARTTLKFLKRVDGIVEFGNRAQLRKVLGLLKGDLRQAHHIIPWELTSNSAVQKAALSSKAFHLNEALNGIPLSSEIIHLGSHPNYNQRVLNRLQSISPNKTPNEVYDEIMNIISDIRNAIKNNPNTPVDQLIF